MDTAQAVVNWLMTNMDTILSIAFAIEVVAVQVVNLTPSAYDNKALAAVHRGLVFLANLVPNAKVTPADLSGLKLPDEAATGTEAVKAE